MDGKFLLDTNIIIKLFRGDKSIENAIISAELIFVSSIVVGELFHGAYLSQEIDLNKERIKSFVETCTILSPDFESAEEYGKIKSELKRKGKPIPENDIWIAAIARQHQLILVTYDKHFENIEQLLIRKW